jgi:hypothetical protein
MASLIIARVNEAAEARSGFSRACIQAREELGFLSRSRVNSRNGLRNFGGEVCEGLHDGACGMEGRRLVPLAASIFATMMRRHQPGRPGPHRYARRAGRHRALLRATGAHA